jgi:hypothetical protein
MDSYAIIDTFWMGVGGGRDAARAKMDVSDEVLRERLQ